MSCLRSFTSATSVAVLLSCGARTTIYDNRDNGAGSVSTGGFFAGHTGGQAVTAGGYGAAAGYPAGGLWNTGGLVSVPMFTGGRAAAGGTTSTGGRLHTTATGGKTYTTGGRTYATGGLVGCVVRDTTMKLDTPTSSNYDAIAIQFQVDVSGTMNHVVPSTGGMTKWAATQKALKDMFSRLPDDWLVGISFFSKPGQCYAASQTVEIAPLSNNLKEIYSAVDSAVVGGDRPIFSAWQYAFTHLTSQWNAPSQYKQIKKYIALVTEPIPNVDLNGCTSANPDQTFFIDWVRDTGAAQGIKTFALAVPGAQYGDYVAYDPLYFLSKVALVGGTTAPGCVTLESVGSDCSGIYECKTASGQPGYCECVTPTGQTVACCRYGGNNNYCYQDLSEVDRTVATLERQILITDGNISSKRCNYPIGDTILSDPYYNAGLLSVRYAPSLSNNPPEILVRAGSSDCGDGAWYVDESTNPTSITLCPTTCAALAQSDGSITLTAECHIIG